MTAREHYRQAEECLHMAWHNVHGDGADSATGQAFAVMAQAHAAMARVALLTADAWGGATGDAARG